MDMASIHVSLNLKRERTKLPLDLQCWHWPHWRLLPPLQVDDSGGLVGSWTWLGCCSVHFLLHYQGPFTFYKVTNWTENGFPSVIQLWGRLSHLLWEQQGTTYGNVGMVSLRLGFHSLLSLPTPGYLVGGGMTKIRVLNLAGGNPPKN